MYEKMIQKGVASLQKRVASLPQGRQGRPSMSHPSMSASLMSLSTVQSSSCPIRPSKSVASLQKGVASLQKESKMIQKCILKGFKIFKESFLNTLNTWGTRWTRGGRVWSEGRRSVWVTRSRDAPHKLRLSSTLGIAFAKSGLEGPSIQPQHRPTIR